VRRLTVEFSVADIARILNEPSVEKIRSMEVLTFLKGTPEEVALICRVRFKDPATNVNEVFGESFEEVQVLERDGESVTCFFRQKRSPWRSGTSPLGSGGYLSVPYEIDDGRLRGTFLGTAKDVREILERIDRIGVRYKVVSLLDAKFSPDSPLVGLTEMQRRVILSAFKLGYYDVPRRVSSQELAEKLDIREPTLVIHRRKAERRLLAALVREP
jgi:predicted DNA binding protein